MKASVPVAQVRELLRDEDAVAYTEPQLLAWWNDAQRNIASRSPQASTAVRTLTLTANETHQRVPDDAYALLDIVRNTNGRGVRIVDRGTVEDFDWGWHTRAPASAITQYMLDPRVPRRFYVYPRPDAGVDVDVVLAIAPADVNALTEDITVLEEYVPAGVDWMMYRCLSRDSRRTPAFQRAMAHYEMFMTQMRSELGADRLSSPVQRQHLDEPTDRAHAQ